MFTPSKKQRLLLISAFRQESSIILDDYSYQHTKSLQKFHLFQLQDYPIYLLELGKISIIDPDSLETIIHQIGPDFMVNFGICGGLTDRVKLHQNYLITRVKHPDTEEITLSQPAVFQKTDSTTILQTAELFSAKEPILDKKKRNDLRKSSACDLVDMEGYLIAHIAQKLDIPLIILKQVSDFADQHAKKLIKNHVRIWQNGLKQGLYEILTLIKQTEN
ncbi:MAG: hypothetical protein JSW33_03825 [bacterium]|nr:MAG: hypothetical protein JSW33_03825 [bacterium]